MKAWQVGELGEPRDVLTLAEVPDPEPGPGQVLVRVLGAATNFPGSTRCPPGCSGSPRAARWAGLSLSLEP